jgi:hypothetical protein
MVPTFLEQIVKSVNKGRALGMLVSFIRKIGNHESYRLCAEERYEANAC